MANWSSLPSELKLMVAEHYFNESPKCHYNGDNMGRETPQAQSAVPAANTSSRPNRDQTALLLVNKQTYTATHHASLKARTTSFTTSASFEAFMQHHKTQGTLDSIRSVAVSLSSHTALNTSILASPTFACSRIERVEVLCPEGGMWACLFDHEDQDRRRAREAVEKLKPFMPSTLREYVIRVPEVEKGWRMQERWVLQGEERGFLREFNEFLTQELGKYQEARKKVESKWARHAMGFGGGGGDGDGGGVLRKRRRTCSI